jgi:transcriptional regulator with XRE-family HTH domain
MTRQGSEAVGAEFESAGLGEDEYPQPRLGQRLKAIREAGGYSLAEVSRRTDISRSFLSLVENGQNEITIGRLIRLIGLYKVHLGDFFMSLGSEQRHIVRREERRRLLSPTEQMRYYLLAPDKERSMLPLFVEFEPYGQLAEMGRHPGEEVIHVLEGEVSLKLEGDEATVLRPGDTAWFDGNRGHFVSNPAGSIAKLISVTSPPNL